MDTKTFFTNYWEAQVKKDKEAFLGYFHADAVIYLHDSNDVLKPEHYLTDDFGGDWHTTVDRIDKLENGQIVTTTFHRSSDWTGFTTSFFTVKNDVITELHEYFSPCDDNIVPQWRTDLAEHEIVK